jgi:pyrroline-5-carboxylate reductase
LNITFIGGGNMAQAIIGGLVHKAGEEFAAESLHVVEINPDTRATLTRELGVRSFEDAAQALRAGDVIVFAVKPQQLRGAAKDLRDRVWTESQASAADHLVISIAAGVRLGDLSRWLGSHKRLIRAMPNTPALIGEAITALCPLAQVPESDLQRAERILGAVGKTVRVGDEKSGDLLMDAVTAVSGSGPAYVFLFMEALEQAAADLGLSADVAHSLALQTFVGAARLASASPEGLAVLRERVTSKGGTTEAALASMAADGVKRAIVRAVRAAEARGRALGEQLGTD